MCGFTNKCLVSHDLPASKTALAPDFFLLLSTLKKNIFKSNYVFAPDFNFLHLP